MSFHQFKNLIATQLKWLSQNSVCLFRLDISKELLWDTYLESYRPQDNPIVNVNRLHDCNCCQGFIKRFSNVCGIVDGKIVTIWDIPTDVPQPFDVVIEAMQNALKDKKISGKFLYDLKHMGVDYNYGNPPTQVQSLMGSYMSVDKSQQRFEHFFCVTPDVAYSNNVSTELSQFEQTHQVIKRSLEELTLEAAQLVLDIANDGNLVRGEQMKPQLEAFVKLYKEWLESNKSDLFIWESVQKYGRLVAIRNTAIGTLLINLSEGMDVSEAIFKYNNIVDPANYKRVVPVFTEKQRQDAANTIKGLGYEHSLQCRHAKLSDISINNVFWTSKKDRTTLKSDPLAFLTEDVKKPIKQLNGSNITVTELMELLPTVSKMEVYLENKHEGNLMNLLTQVNEEEPSILQWDNPFRWSYKGDLTGASKIKESVKLAGGNTEGVLNFRLAWNEGGIDNSDLDAWATEPSGNKIGFNTGYRKDSGNRFSPNKGQLDVDDRGYGKNLHVENITWTEATNGSYKLWVNQYSDRNSQGFVAEIEFGGEIHIFSYNKPVRGNVTVATVKYLNGKWSIEPNSELTQSISASAIWGLDTNKYYPVSTFMLSPNYWDKKVGNPHYFFFIEGLHNPNSCRSVYNEYLNKELSQHKRVFEMLGSKLRVEPENEQMAGIGFTLNDQHLLKVKLDGRPYNVNFKGNLMKEAIQSEVTDNILI